MAALPRHHSVPTQLAVVFLGDRTQSRWNEITIDTPKPRMFAPAINLDALVRKPNALEALLVRDEQRHLNPQLVPMASKRHCGEIKRLTKAITQNLTPRSLSGLPRTST
jgi:hypothetical protein